MGGYVPFGKGVAVSEVLVVLYEAVFSSFCLGGWVEGKGGGWMFLWFFSLSRTIYVTSPFAQDGVY